VTWATSVPILVFLGLSVLELDPMYATVRQTLDRRQTNVRKKHRLMPPPYGDRGIITSRTTGRNKPNNLQYNVGIRLPKQLRLQFSSKHQYRDGADVMSSVRVFQSLGLDQRSLYPLQTVAVFIIPAKKVTYSSEFVRLLVCWQDYAKTSQPISQNSVERWRTYGPRKKPLDFCGHPDHAKIALG